MNCITRSGTQLQNAGVPFRFAGPNLPWLGLIWPPQDQAARYPTNAEIDDGLLTAVEMGATVVRSHTLGISVGHPLAIEPTLGTFQAVAFAPIDYALKRCNDLGLRVIIPLCDNYHFYPGGKHVFTDWRGLSNEDLFYSNAQVIADFEQYVSTLLTHVNTLTGVAYLNSPAILAWETGNELTPPTSWTSTISAYLKSLDSNHLVMDGNYGVNSAALSIATVDLYSDHLYPLQVSRLTSDASLTNGANKALVVGELDWRPNVTAGAGLSLIDNSTAYTGSYSAKTVVSSGSPMSNYVQFRQTGLTLEPGNQYTLTFAAKADVTRPIQIAVQSASSPYTMYYCPAPLVIGTAWATYSYAFTMNNATDANTMLCFDLAQVVGSVWLDSVSLAPANGANLLPNGDFETGALSPWALVNKNTVPDALSSLEASVEGNSAVSGDLYWALFPHRAPYGFDLEEDGFSLYYPCQDSASQAQAQELRTHAYTMAGQSVPGVLIPAAPTLNPITKAGGGYSVSWGGVVGAATYALEQSTSGPSGPWTVLGSAYTDLSTPVSVPALLACWYRVRGVNPAGVAGPYSTVMPGPD